ncbi:CIC11C00000005536 [Sungouiella intermedia]|uniref:CIC11C00000005536 n=1 Tax=Sungouiella intermedia TaxID=45354 RepID=A0A1L0BC84_9ASCO|nr:CIC11C00000005536 [[Candida] intermedia]
MKYLQYGYILTFLTACVLANSHVYDLTPANFDQVVNQSNYTSIVEFYAPWCGYCKQLEPIYHRMASFLHRDGKYAVNVARVNCDKDINKPLCQANRVQGFPTLIVFRPPKFQPGKSKKARHVPEVYNGQRTLKPMVDYVTSRIKNYVKKVHNLKSAGLPDWLSKGKNRDKVLLITSSADVTPLYKTMAIDFLGSLSFAAVTAQKIHEVPSVTIDGETIEFPVKDGDNLPILLVYKPSSKTFERYTGGNLKLKEKLEKWLMEVTGAVPGEGSLAQKNSRKKGEGRRKRSKDEL